MKWTLWLPVVWALGLALTAFSGLASATAEVPRGLVRHLGQARALMSDCIRLVSFHSPGPRRAARTLQLLDEIHTKAGNTILLPEDCFAGEPKFDVVIHFHGIQPVLEPALSVSGVRAAMLITTDGIGAEAYAQKYQFEQSLPQLIAGVERAVNLHCHASNMAIRRVALSAWSAGYGAISRILRWPHQNARVDAVLLADGLHAPYTGGGELNGPSLEHFLDYAKRAQNGEVLFAATHSAISTPGYASTTETADYLLRELHLTRTLEDSKGPRPGMRRMYHADRGAFHIRGFDGTDPKAHANHQRALGDTLLPLLAEFWKRRVPQTNGR